MSRLFVNRLTVIDYSYLHAERGLLGDSLLADVELVGDLDTQGMVLDFGDVKKQLKRAIDAHFDHKLVVPARHPGLTIDDLPDGRQRLLFPLAVGGAIEHIAPADAVTLVDAGTITPDSLTVAIQDTLRPLMPANVSELKIRLAQEAIEGPAYQYSHGLKLHDGNCQRIAHGHRSRLRILRDGEPDTGLTAEWAARWRDIYIGTREDLAEETELAGRDCYCFRYQARQGEFELTLPKDHCYLIDSESTVENLAQHIAETLHVEHPDARIEVQAFEGVDKGAFGEACPPLPAGGPLTQ
jgi:6-pyruvoyl-tetrahydropterin synthase